MVGSSWKAQMIDPCGRVVALECQIMDTKHRLGLVHFRASLSHIVHVSWSQSALPVVTVNNIRYPLCQRAVSIAQQGCDIRQDTKAQRIIDPVLAVGIEIRAAFTQV